MGWGQVDGGQAAEAGLASSLVVGDFDPGDDCEEERFENRPIGAG